MRWPEWLPSEGGQGHRERAQDHPACHQHGGEGAAGPHAGTRVGVHGRLCQQDRLLSLEYKLLMGICRRGHGEVNVQAKRSFWNLFSGNISADVGQLRGAFSVFHPFPVFCGFAYLSVGSIQCLAKLKGRFHPDQSVGHSEPDLRHPPTSQILLRRTLDVGSQTDVSGEVRGAVILGLFCDVFVGIL